ncbi:MAG: S8 family serine peptidase [Candidatus Bathycorpusculaceae bacterium]
MQRKKLNHLLIAIAIITLFSTKTVYAIFNPVSKSADYILHLGSNDSICADEDSMEIVIGVDSSEPESYAKLVEAIAEDRGKIVNTISIRGETIAVVADMPLNTVSSFREKTSKNALARYIEPNMKFQALFTPNDQYWNLQWGTRKIRADWAWNTTVGDNSILVAVIDTGVDYNHPDLVANYVPLGRDWVNNDTNPMDDNGHGTHCAGIIAATLNNALGVAGLAQVHIMAEKALDAEGEGWEDDLANAIIHAAENGAKILSNSWGGYEDSILLHEAIRYAYNMGLLIVASAGNEASNVKIYPAAYNEVVAVTATDSDDAPAGFTSFGSWVEVAAPGVNIYSTFWDDSYTYMSGTSMACPHVVGVAALIWSQFPSATRDWVRAQLRYTADDLGDSGFDEYYGYGRVNAEKAVRQLPPEHDILILSWEKPEHIRSGERFWFNVTVMNFGASSEQNLTVQLLINDEIVDSASINQLASNAVATADLSWNPAAGGTYNLTVYAIPVPSETATENNAVSETVSVMSIILDPASGLVGTKVAVIGVGFEPESIVVVTFNDFILGDCITDEFGGFTFVFNVPVSLAENQTVKAYYSQDCISAEFTVIEIASLYVQMDVSATYFRGETAEFYAQITFNGKAVNATAVNAVLYKPNGTAEILTPQLIAIGLYKLSYAVPEDASNGTYTLVVAAEYIIENVNASGTSFKCFTISPTLTEIFLKVIEINGTTATIQTLIGIVNGTITEINGNIATIVVPGLGQIQTDISGLKGTQAAWNILQYATLAFALVGAFSALSSTVLLLRRRKAAETG